MCEAAPTELIRTAKKLLNDIEHSSLPLAIGLEGQCYSRLRSSGDFRERRRSLRCQATAEFSRKMMRGSRQWPSAQPAARRLNYEDQLHDKALLGSDLRNPSVRAVKTNDGGSTSCA
jgi:hypothetical protein